MVTAAFAYGVSPVLANRIVNCTRSPGVAVLRSAVVETASAGTSTDTVWRQGLAAVQVEPGAGEETDVLSSRLPGSGSATFTL